MSFTEKDFQDALVQIGIIQNDNLFVHSNLGLLGASKPGLDIAQLVLDSLLRAVGKFGSIILPAFTYSHGHGSVFDKNSSSGLTKMGILTTKAFERGFFRSDDPMFSLLGEGHYIQKLITNEKQSSFGVGSAFRKIIDANSKVLSINMGVGSTLLHEIENSFGANYRYLKEFHCDVANEPENSIDCINWKAYVRKIEIEGSGASFNRVTSLFTQTTNWHSVRIGRGQIGTYELGKMEKFLKNILPSDQWLLTERGIPTQIHRNF
jgi:aminoglycoside 3-N-acetyltransferase